MTGFQFAMYLFIIACFIVAALPPGWRLWRRSQRTLTNTEPTVQWDKLGFKSQGDYVYRGRSNGDGKAG